MPEDQEEFIICTHAQQDASKQVQDHAESLPQFLAAFRCSSTACPSEEIAAVFLAHPAAGSRRLATSKRERPWPWRPAWMEAYRDAQNPMTCPPSPPARAQLPQRAAAMTCRLSHLLPIVRSPPPSVSSGRWQRETRRPCRSMRRAQSGKFKVVSGLWLPCIRSVHQQAERVWHAAAQHAPAQKGRLAPAPSSSRPADLESVHPCAQNSRY